MTPPVSAADLSYFDFEANASTIRAFQNALVPGLLQTDDYARTIFVELLGYADDDVEESWQTRQVRQELHVRDAPPEMRFVLDEAVVRRSVGGRAVMRRQLEALQRWAERPHVQLQVMPFAAGAHPEMRGPFIVLELSGPDHDEFLYQEYPTGATTAHDESVTGHYRESFSSLSSKALSPTATDELIATLIADL